MNISGKLFAALHTIEDAGKFHRDFALRQYMAPIIAFTKTDMKYSEYSENFNTKVIPPTELILEVHTTCNASLTVTITNLQVSLIYITLAHQ